MSDNLERELVELIIKFCGIENIAPADIQPDSPLIGPESPLGLDSLDAVEVVVAVQKTYGARIGNENTSREVLRSISTLAAHVRENRTS